jgi:hypothetical protein
MKISKKAIGIIGSSLAGVGAFLGYLDSIEHEDKLASIEKRITDVEERSRNEEAGARSKTEEAD